MKLRVQGVGGVGFSCCLPLWRVLELSLHLLVLGGL